MFVQWLVHHLLVLGCGIHAASVTAVAVAAVAVSLTTPP